MVAPALPDERRTQSGAEVSPGTDDPLARSGSTRSPTFLARSRRRGDGDPRRVQGAGPMRPDAGRSSCAHSRISTTARCRCRPRVAPSSPGNRFLVGVRGLSTTYGPTELHRRTVQAGRSELTALKSELDRIAEEGDAGAPASARGGGSATDRGGRAVDHNGQGSRLAVAANRCGPIPVANSFTAMATAALCPLRSRRRRVSA